MHRVEVRARHADARHLVPLAAPPSFPHLVDRAFSRGPHPEGSLGRGLGEGQASPAPTLPRPATAVGAETLLVRQLRASIEEDLSSFDFRQLDASKSVVAASFLDALPTEEFNVFRATVLSRHARAANRALEGYAALEAKMKALNVFPDSLNRQRVHARCACDMRRASGAINLTSIAQLVIHDMQRGGSLLDGIVQSAAAAGVRGGGPGS